MIDWRENFVHIFQIYLELGGYEDWLDSWTNQKW